MHLYLLEILLGTPTSCRAATRRGHKDYPFHLDLSPQPHFLPKVI